MVFIDYLTKWVEVYLTKDQTALTLARMLAEKFIPVHRVPREILSDRGANFLSNTTFTLTLKTGSARFSTVQYWSIH